MFEIERLLKVKIDIEAGGYDGTHLHYFLWESDVQHDTPSMQPDMESASGWACMHWMYGVPKSPREAAELLAACFPNRA